MIILIQTMMRWCQLKELHLVELSRPKIICKKPVPFCQQVNRSNKCSFQRVLSYDICSLTSACVLVVLSPPTCSKVLYGILLSVGCLSENYHVMEICLNNCNQLATRNSKNMSYSPYLKEIRQIFHPMTMGRSPLNNNYVQNFLKGFFYSL